MLEHLPSIELLEATHAFPCAYTFKVIGHTDDHFVGRVVGAVRALLDACEEPAFSSRKTHGGKYVCVTIEPIMSSASHVLQMYRQLRELDGLVMLL